jgi:hypothetical protein
MMWLTVINLCIDNMYFIPLALQPYIWALAYLHENLRFASVY